MLCGVSHFGFPRCARGYNHTVNVAKPAFFNALLLPGRALAIGRARRSREWCRLLSALFALFVSGLCQSAFAAPEAHILRIDPRTAVHDGDPVLTAVIDLTVSERVGDLTKSCATLRGDEQLDCVSKALQNAKSLSRPYPFHPEDVLFSVRVGDKDHQAKLISHSTFGESQDEPGIGTAWLIIVDADERMNKALDEAAALATRFVDSMGPQDLVNVIFISDRQVISDTKWLPRAQLRRAKKSIQAQKKTLRSQGRTRPLLDLIKSSASDSFRGLSNSSEGVEAPLHQAMVVISTGYGGGDPSTTGPGAEKLSLYFSKGRFDDDNTALPKLPIPVISIFVPPKARAENRDMARTFMQNLANPAIGGYFTILRDGQAERSSAIVDAVRTRFRDLVVARFRLSCVAPKTTQSFSLGFRGKSSGVIGDSSFKNVPVGFEPGDWPLDIDVELTRKTAADSGGIQPGGRLRIFGNFCWGGDLSRPEVYFLPPGEKLPEDLSSDPEAAKKVQKRLTALDMRAPATQANSTFAEFQVPDAEQILHGEETRRVVRFIVVDTQMQRTSGLTQATVLTLKGTPKKLVWWPFAAGGGALAALLLLLGIVLRRGSEKTDSLSPNDRSRIEESPYATPSPVSRINRSELLSLRATLEGKSGRFVVLPSSELRIGRDGARSAAVIDNPQVSGLHATFRMESHRLLLRDEGSTSGTRIDGRLIDPGRWEVVPEGSEVSIGPELLRVTVSQSA